MKKTFRSSTYNYNFDTETGYFERWGATEDDNPSMAPSAEILDIEIATSCHGIGSGPCKHCYKSNTPKGEYLSYDRFKEMFDKIPDFTTQVALGIGDINSNPDLFKIADYLNNRDIIPNITTNGYGMTDELADKFADTFGAVAVSRYNPKDVCYNAVKKLTDAELQQVNIHVMVSEETYLECIQTIDDRLHDARLEKLNAIVFLLLKPKGNRNKYTPISFEKYSNLVKYALESGVSIGFDSCSAPLFLEASKNSKNFQLLQQMSDSCESYLFSLYINVKGEVFPCSFCEGEDGHTPIDMFEIKDFQTEVWQSKKADNWRSKLLATNSKCGHLGSDCRLCPQFDIYNGAFK